MAIKSHSLLLITRESKLIQMRLVSLSLSLSFAVCALPWFLDELLAPVRLLQGLYG